MTDHPITPPPELVEQWVAEKDFPTFDDIATQAARWGADQELKACSEWLYKYQYDKAVVMLLASRRPKPPSLKEQALKALNQADKGLTKSEWQQCSDTIRRALEALPSD